MLGFSLSLCTRYDFGVQLIVARENELAHFFLIVDSLLSHLADIVVPMLSLIFTVYI